MLLEETLEKLQTLGSDKLKEQNKKRGAGDNQYGVKMGDIRKIADKLRKNHALALQLWDTGNIEARSVAILIVKPTELSAEELEQWVRSETYTWVADWLYSYVIKEYPEKDRFREKWMNSDDKMCARAGWSLMAGRVAREPEGIDLNALLDRLEKEMPFAPPEVQWTMNNTLANIGIHHPDFRERALAIGEKLGIYRDYPVSKGCTSPFAPIWIREMVGRGAK